MLQNLRKGEQFQKIVNILSILFEGNVPWRAI
jgi:hypothetical protein